MKWPLSNPRILSVSSANACSRISSPKLASFYRWPAQIQKGGGGDDIRGHGTPNNAARLKSTFNALSTNSACSSADLLFLKAAGSGKAKKGNLYSTLTRS